jgi:hypothetical protein
VRFKGGLKNNLRSMTFQVCRAMFLGVYVFGKRLCPGLTEHCKFICWVFQSVYVRNDWIPESCLPTPDDGHKMSAIEVSEDEVECASLGLGTRPGRNYTSYVETVGFGCQSSFDILF